MTRPTLALLGAGAMGSAVLEAVLRAGLFEPADVRVTTLDESAAERWRVRGVQVAQGNADAIDGRDGPGGRDNTDGVDVALVAVKPADVPDVLDDIADRLGPDTLVISVAAGVPLATLAQHLPEGTATVRVMPNTPALLGQGMSALSPGEHCGEAGLAMARELFTCCGRVVVVPEKHQDAVTAVSGSGPAYVFSVAEALIDAGVLLGLPRAVAAELTIQTLVGSATMLRDCDAPPSLLRERVTSPGGTTAAALREFDRHGLRSAIIAAAEAGHARSKELGS